MQGKYEVPFCFEGQSEFRFNSWDEMLFNLFFPSNARLKLSHEGHMNISNYTGETFH